MANFASPVADPAALLSLRQISVKLSRAPQAPLLLQNIDLDLGAGEIVGLVGESGSGKTTLGLTCLGLLAGEAHISGGSVALAGQQLSCPSQAQVRRLMRRRLGVVFQDPQAALNPYLRIGQQLDEVPRPQRISGKQRRQQALEMLEQVGIGEPHKFVRAYPHTLSGGMRQRAAIAMALLMQPDFLIADEPTTALDVTLQAEVLSLLERLCQTRNMGLLFISHDLGVVARLCERVIVMHEGRIVEDASAQNLFAAPTHPYTQQLLAHARSNTAAAAIATTQGKSPRTAPPKQPPILRAANVCVEVARPGGAWWRKTRVLRLLQNVDISVEAGEILAIVGESGSGKSTLGRALVQLQPMAEGEVFFANQPVRSARWGKASAGAYLGAYGRFVQMVFQDTKASLDPRQRVGDAIAEPMVIHKLGAPHERAARVVALLEEVGLTADFAQRLPQQLSGGQAQRVVLARALAAQPRVLIADEPTSALDAAVKAQILALLAQLAQRRQMAVVFISHDLAAVEQYAQRVAVMYLGQIVEMASATRLLQAPLHPYSQALVAAAPVADPKEARRRAAALPPLGEPPSIGERPLGCSFHPRCPNVQPRCRREAAPLVQICQGRQAACHLLPQQSL